MSWAGTLPTTTDLHLTGWGPDLLDLGPVPVETAWTGVLSVPAAGLPAVAEMFAPSASSSARVVVPPSIGGGVELPAELPFPVRERASMAAAAQMLIPLVGVGPNVVAVPSMTGAGVLEDPGAASGATVFMPDGASGLPWQLPHQLAAPSGSMLGHAAMMPPGVVADMLVVAVQLSASAALVAPGVLAGAALVATVMQAAAGLLAPSAASGATGGVPGAGASAGLPAPSIAAGAGVAPPAMTAAADMPVPGVELTILDFIAEAPVMEAVAEMLVPVQEAVAVVPPMHASAGSGNLPFQLPLQLVAPSGFLRPDIGSLWVPATTAAADLPDPGVASGATGTAPAASAAAGLPAPGVAAGARAVSPVLAASGLLHAPGSVGPNYMAPSTQTFSTAGAYTCNLPADWLLADIIVLGGGRGGKDGGGGYSAGKGGAAGSWGVWTIVRGTNVPWSFMQITGTVGAAGTRSGNNGGASTAVVSGYGTLTGNGGGGDAGGQNGGAAGSQTVSGVTYSGGAGGTGNGGAGTAPGAGGAGGNGGLFSGSNGGNGAAGRVWVRAYQ